MALTGPLGRQMRHSSQQIHLRSRKIGHNAVEQVTMRGVAGRANVEGGQNGHFPDETS